MTNIGTSRFHLQLLQHRTATPGRYSRNCRRDRPVDPLPANTPIWRNIVISNLRATVASGGEAGFIWGRTEMPVTNVTLRRSISPPPRTSTSTTSKCADCGTEFFVDSQINLTGGGNTFSLYNAQFTITNSAPATNVFSLDGLAGTNSLALFNARAAMSDSAARPKPAHPERQHALEQHQSDAARCQHRELRAGHQQRRRSRGRQSCPSTAR